ncbi:PQQ-binding-like beta-propeller repeat protein [bacterium]|nr:PQQ-binding-like beta-propeller repeat protein [bacterium]
MSQETRIASSDRLGYQPKLRHAILNDGLKLGQGLNEVGRPYDWMIDCREVLLSPESLHHAARLLWERIKPYAPEAVGGMTLAANPLVVALLYESRADGYPLQGFIIRKEPKGNGLQKWVEGPPLRPGARVVLLDDIVNSGDTQRRALEILAPFQPEVLAVGALIDCERSGSNWLKGRQIPLEALFTLDELGIDPGTPRAPGTYPIQWEWGPLNHGRYAIPKSRPCITEQGLYVGGDAGFLAALTLDGRERWRFAVRDRERGVHATPLVHQGRVYFGAYDGFLYCLDADNGRLIWETRPGQWIGSSPALDPGRDRLFIGVESGEAGGSLMAFDAQTGQVAWELKAKHYIHSAPFFDAVRDQVIVGANDYAVYAADAETGALRWQFVTGGEVKGDPIVDPEGRCFVGSFDGYLYALSAESGDLLWKRQLAKSLQVRPLVHGDLVIVGGSSSRVVALDRETGEIRWVATTGGAVIGGAAAFGDRIAVGSADGRLYILDGESGSLVDRLTTNGAILTTPGTGQGLLAFASFDGKLRAIATA